MLTHFTFLLLSLLLQQSSSSPTGASGCEGDGPAVGGPHLDNAVSGSLEDFGLKVSVGDVVLETSGTLSIPADADNFVYLYAEEADAAKEYRGFLFRLSNPSGDSTLGFLTIPESIIDEAQVAAVCTDLNVAGITHINNDLKSNMVIQLNVPDKMDGLVLDITAVIINRLVNETWVSEYYSSQYTVNVGEAGESTIMPTTAPFNFPDGGGDSSSTMLSLALGWSAVCMAFILIL